MGLEHFIELTLNIAKNEKHSRNVAKGNIGKMQLKNVAKSQFPFKLINGNIHLLKCCDRCNT